jgi:hypothetical protein
MLVQGVMMQVRSCGRDLLLRFLTCFSHLWRNDGGSAYHGRVAGTQDSAVSKTLKLQS